MKRIYIIPLASFILLAGIKAQNETDALRYSQNFYGGTARAISMGGAFGALGGDFTNASLNPAGIGVYRSTEFSFTPTLLYDNTSTNYLGEKREDNRYQFALNNLGFVHSNLTGKDQGWVSVNFGIGYNQLNNYNRNTMMNGIQVSGNNQSSSMLDNFTNNANAGNWSDFYEELAWATDVIVWDSLAGEWWNDINEAGYGQTQRRRIQESGSLGEIAFTLAANYGNRLYIGGTFGIHRLRYSSFTDHMEMDDAGIIPYFNSFTFRESLETRGTGYTFKAGIIFRPVSLIRIGAAFHLPTFYKIREDFYTDMSSTFDDANVADLFERSPVNQFDYWLRTPYKAIGSVAVQLGRIALISAEYEYMDYSEANFDSRGITDYDLLYQNDRIKEVLSSAHNVRAGAELHLGPMYLRGGASFYDSPYKSTEINAESWNISFSGGLGFRSKNVFFDLAYSIRQQDYHYYLYIPEDTRGAKITENRHMAAATLGFRF
jgi:hypothetical protein